MIKDFALPDLGEGLTESELIEWHVAVGDTVELNQPIAEVETAKAIVQLPSPFAGVVATLYVQPGSTVTVGTPIVAFEVAAVPAAAPAPAPTAAAPTAAPERNAVLVGYGPAVETGERPRRKPRSFAEEPVFVPARGAALSTPPVRRLAHDLGVDMSLVRGTGDGGAITREDVQGAASPVPGRARETRTPIRGVRKATAAAMVASAFTAPHVTEFLTVDVTRTTELVGRLKAGGQGASALAVVAKALCIAVGRNPTVNSRWDEQAGEIVQFGSVNLGIAVATPRGLMVPNLKDAQALSLGDLTTAIAALPEAARAGSSTPEALGGGTITITNIGVFGIDAGTPILNPGEAAILAMGAVRRMPAEFEGAVALREMMTLSLSFDHRLVDGEQGARFLTDIGGILADPASVLALV
ncbi:MAG: branched-chain alpha-keto acid dehydrogenase subunit [Rhodoglobus sp.]|nr:branched-chain alpha-keto acid dehydrogenase subunit [Rhodoglobus sp.]